MAALTGASGECCARAMPFAGPIVSTFSRSHKLLTLSWALDDAYICKLAVGLASAGHCDSTAIACICVAAGSVADYADALAKRAT